MCIRDSADTAAPETASAAQDSTEEAVFEDVEDVYKRQAEKVEKIVTIENHSIIGGLGGLVAETICDMPKHAPLARVGVEDVFTESGSLKAVKEKYGLTVENVLKKLEEV